MPVVVSVYFKAFILIYLISHPVNCFHEHLDILEYLNRKGMTRIIEIQIPGPAQDRP